MRQGNVYYNEHLAGIITETGEGEYVFQYDTKYAEEHSKEFITFTMPVTGKKYTEKRLFPFLKV